MNYTTQTPENQARHDLINPALEKAGWTVQHFKNANIYADKGVAVEYFQLGKNLGEADYILFVNGVACGVVEAKKEGETLIGKEPQTKKYAEGFPEDFQRVDSPLPFIYESTGTETRFTNNWDPTPRSREVFNFHRPETFEKMINEKESLRKRLTQKFPLENDRLWDAQRTAIENLEESLANSKPRSLIQMATGSGKTYTAVNICYRLIKNTDAKRILFLVDRGNLGIQTENEFTDFTCPDDGRKFSELYNVNRLENNSILDSDKVVISTIQRVYSILKGEKNLDSEKEEETDLEAQQDKELEVEYNPDIPIEMFDFIIIDESHRSIYNLWRQVLDYFDAFLIGLTATPSKRTIGFFDKNLVMEYSHETAVANQINVDFDVYRIRTKITNNGSYISQGERILKRDKRTRRKKWETTDDEIQYDQSKLDKDVVAKDQIRTVVRTFRDKITTEIFPDRENVPKTLIYAKDDSHAEDIVNIVREEFNEGNDFCQKITYKTEGIKSDDLIKQFRNEFYPRIAVTVDKIATGTDIKPLEVVFFMRSVKSRNYFEQMKGRGVRVIKNDDFRTVTPDATAKERFVIVDAVGVCESDELSDTNPIEQKPNVSFEKLLKAIRYGKPNEANLSSMASRLVRLHKKLTDEKNNEVKGLADGKTLPEFANSFLDAVDSDKIYEQAQHEYGDPENYEEYEPKKKELFEVANKRMLESVKDFVQHTQLMERLPDIKKEAYQIIDDVSIDEVEEAAYSPIAKEKAKETVGSFKKFIEEHKDELTAIQAFYNNHKLHWSELKELADKIRTPPYNLTTSKLWRAYHQLEDGKVHGSAKKIIDFVSLLKHEIENTNELEPFRNTVEKRFQAWLSKQQSMGVEFSDEQLKWLKQIKNHIAESVEITPDDFELSPFDQMGGLGKAAQIFGNEKITEILDELNRELSV
ncbi:MAG: type I restriction-modification enzyme R subunit C-terminal domain-containing protein [Nanoarchaeota archaeon]